MEKQLYSGADALYELEAWIKKHSPRSILLVRGKSSYQTSGAKAALEHIFHTGGSYRVLEYYDFSENPKSEDVRKGLELLESETVDLILAVGGGSVLDMAKMIRFFHSYPGDVADTVFRKQEELIPLVAIPTTAGTGCETTQFAVVYKDRVKYSVGHPDMAPDIAVIHPPFTYHNPAYLTACTGFDALAQAIEAYWNVNSSDLSDEYAIRAIGLLWPYLPAVVNSPDKHVRDQVMQGAYWAGKAINLTKTTAPHAFSYPFTTFYGFPHGNAVALTFPFFMEYNCLMSGVNLSPVPENQSYEKKISFLFEMIGFNNRGEQSLKEYFFEYLRSLQLRFVLPEDFDEEVVKKNVNVQRLNNNPVPVDEQTTMLLLADVCSRSEMIKNENNHSERNN